MSSLRDETAYVMDGMTGHTGMTSQISWKEGIEEDFQTMQDKLPEVEQSGATPQEQPIKTIKKRSQNTRLSELEQQLEIAETRCDTLKQQLDYMKLLYHGANHEPQAFDKAKVFEKPEREKPDVQRKSRSNRVTTHPSRTESSLERKQSFTVLKPVCELEKPERDLDCSRQVVSLVTDLSYVDAPTKEQSQPQPMMTQADGSNNGVSAVQVIQDILCGITDSVNRISQLNVHIEDSPKDLRGHRHRASARRSHSHEPIEPPVSVPAPSCSTNHLMYEPEQDSSISPRRRDKPRSRAGLGGTGKKTLGSVLSYAADSVESLHTARRKGNKSHQKRPKQLAPCSQAAGGAIKPKRNVEDPVIKLKKRRGKVKASASRSTFLSKKAQKQSSYNNMHLVELYHNSSARPGTSASEDHKVHTRSSSHSSSPEYHAPTRMGSDELLAHATDPYREEPHLPQSRSCMQPMPMAKEPTFTMSVRRNFELPTVSSKLKQVDKTFFHRYNFRNIPFVAGRSTSPSHNLGLNIQQALSIIKMRQPMLSPAPMIVAAEMARCPYRTGTGPSCRRTCPAAHTMPFMPDLPELPERNEVMDPVQGERSEKTIVADIEPPVSRFGKLAGLVRGVGSFTPPDQDCVSVAGVMLDSVNRSENVWNVDQEDERLGESMRSRCTCFPTRQCIDYQKLLSQYLESGKGMAFFQVMSQPSVPCYRAPYRPRHLRTNKGPAVESVGPPEPQPIGDDNNNFSSDNPYMDQLKSRSRGLKEVLLNLHNDFVRLNDKYTELQGEVTSDGTVDSEALQQLEAMEAELQSKEDEITVVMALYKEVMSLKEQVRALRERTSQQSITTPCSSMIPPRQRRIVLREPTVSVRLTRLLRTVQRFQEKLREE